MEVVPSLWRLKATRNSRIFQDMTLPEIVKKVLNSTACRCATRCRRTYTKVDYCVQYRESDFAFVSRLLEEEGIGYFFEHNDDSHVMVLADHTSAYQPCPELRQLQLHRGGLVERLRDGGGPWEASRQIRARACIVRDHHFQMFDKSLECFEFRR